MKRSQGFFCNVSKTNAPNIFLEYCSILVWSPRLHLLPSIIICNRCYLSCLGILRDLRWDLFLPNTIMLINSCFGDLCPPDPLWSAQPGPSSSCWRCQASTERPLSCQVGRRLKGIVRFLEGNFLERRQLGMERWGFKSERVCHWWWTILSWSAQTEQFVSCVTSLRDLRNTVFKNTVSSVRWAGYCLHEAP